MQLSLVNYMVPKWMVLEMVRVFLPVIEQKVSVTYTNPIKILAKAFLVIKALAPHNSFSC